MINLITTIVRTFILYIFVTLSIRIMGKRQIGDMQPNELVVTLLISEIAAIPLQDTEQPVFVGVAAIFMLVFIEIVISVLAMKSFFIRKIFSGRSQDCPNPMRWVWVRSAISIRKQVCGCRAIIFPSISR